DILIFDPGLAPIVRVGQAGAIGDRFLVTPIVLLPVVHRQVVQEYPVIDRDARRRDDGVLLLRLFQGRDELYRFTVRAADRAGDDPAVLRIRFNLDHRVTAPVVALNAIPAPGVTEDHVGLILVLEGEAEVGASDVPLLLSLRRRFRTGELRHHQGGSATDR